MEYSPDSGTSVIEISWHHLEMRDLSEKVGAKKSLGNKKTQKFGALDWTRKEVSPTKNV